MTPFPIAKPAGEKMHRKSWRLLDTSSPITATATYKPSNKIYTTKRRKEREEEMWGNKGYTSAHKYQDHDYSKHANKLGLVDKYRYQLCKRDERGNSSKVEHQHERDRTPVQNL